MQERKGRIMKKRICFPALICLIAVLTACGIRQEAPRTDNAGTEPRTVNTGAAETALPPYAAASVPPTGAATPKEEEKTMEMTIGATPVQVEWENNESVQALRALCQAGPLRIRMSMYGGFEQVGALGAALPRSDTQTVTSAGDIVLYAGNQIVVFYGSNTWAYTRLGRITDKTAGEMANLLGNGDVEITLTVR